MKQHGLSSLWALTIGVAALTVIQLKALDEGINGTLMLFTVCGIGSMVSMFLGLKAKDIKATWDAWRK